MIIIAIRCVGWKISILQGHTQRILHHRIDTDMMEQNHKWMKIILLLRKKVYFPFENYSFVFEKSSNWMTECGTNCWNCGQVRQSEMIEFIWYVEFTEFVKFEEIFFCANIIFGQNHLSISYLKYNLSYFHCSASLGRNTWSTFEKANNNTWKSYSWIASLLLSSCTCVVMVSLYSIRDIYT